MSVTSCWLQNVLLQLECYRVVMQNWLYLHDWIKNKPELNIILVVRVKAK